jgi:cytochrome b561
MMVGVTTPHYDRTARWLHWLVAALFLSQFAFGWWLTDIPRGTPARGFFVNLHKSMGMLLGLLIVLRIGWRLMHSPPAWPSTLARYQRVIATASHHALYVCMLLMPVSGYVASNFSKHGVKFFNLITLPPWGPDDKTLYAVFNQIHKVTAVVLFALLVLHVSAAAWHGLRRDGIFSRIWLRGR